MKLKILVLFSAIFLTACSNGAGDVDGSGGSGARNGGQANQIQPITPVNNSADDVQKALSDSELQALDNTKCGYGQGVLLDNDNRPLGALDFNTRYGKYNAKAITDDESTIYLTFDQGYENGYTPVILDTLKEKGVKAVFFVLQDYAERNPELIKRMIDEGHTIGNHSVHHYSMPSVSVSECEDEINGLHQYMLDNYGYEMTLFRPPMGEFSERTIAVTQKCGYKTLLWSYAYADWDVNNQPDSETAFNKLCNAVHSGAVYLLHSVSKTNAEVLGRFIDEVQSNGYTFGAM